MLQRLNQAFDFVMLWGLFAVVAFGPLAFGAVEEWSIFIVRVGAALLFLLWAAKQFTRGEVELAPSPLFAPVAAFALIALAQVALGRTVYWQATWTEFLNYVTCAALFFIASQVFTDEKPLKQFSTALAIYGSLIALFAIVQDLTFNAKIYWARVPTGGGVIYGPYVNHNHYAGLMEMLLPIPLIASVVAVHQGGKRILVGFCALLMACSIFLSLSRGGMLALGAQLLVAAVLLVKRTGNRTALVLLIIIILGAGLLLWIGKEQLSPRLATLRHPFEELSAVNRFAIARDTLHMFRERPVLGWGLGTFSTVYPGFRSFHSNLLVNQAHNDYVQVLAEAGLLGFVVVIWGVLVLYRRGLQILRRGTGIGFALRNAALIGCTGILVHSLFDFNLHVPANAVLFCVLAAIATARLHRVTGRLPNYEAARRPVVQFVAVPNRQN